MLYKMTSSQSWHSADMFNFLKQGRTVIHPAAVSNSKYLSILGRVFQFQNWGQEDKDEVVKLICCKFLRLLHKGMITVYGGSFNKKVVNKFRPFLAITSQSFLAMLV